ncbi:MAG: ribonuclease Z [Halobacteria archaeon]
MKLTLLGTGSADSQAERTSTSLVVEHEGLLHLLDCGPTVPHRLVSAGYRPENLDVVALSHTHGDHLLGLPILLHDMKTARRAAPLHLLLPAGALPVVRSVVEFSFPGFWEKAPFEVKFKELGGERAAPRVPGSPRAALTIHGVPCYGLRLGPLCYSADTAPCERVAALARGCAVLVHEASSDSSREEAANRYGHSSARQAGEAARAAGAERLLLVHMGPGAPPEALESEARAAFGGKVEAGRELLRMEL